MPIDAVGDLAERLDAGAHAAGVELPPRQRHQLLRFVALLMHWNRVYNLTAVREPADMLRQHLLDCLAIVPSLRRQTAGHGARLLDVGSGAGLPGIVLAVTMPELAVTCVDAVGKKASFIRQAAAELGLGALQVQHARVESLRSTSFDIVVSRAFASLAHFARATDACVRHPALEDDGVWLAMKGRLPVDELNSLPAGVEVFHVEQMRIPGFDAERCLIWMRPSQAP